MICTFGDTTDVTWWRELNLAMRPIIGRDGRLLPEAPDGVDPEAYAAIAGLTTKQAQTAVVEQLGAAGLLIGEPRPIQHPVKFYERGERPLGGHARNRPAVAENGEVQKRTVFATEQKCVPLQGCATGGV